VNAADWILRVALAMAEDGSLREVKAFNWRSDVSPLASGSSRAISRVTCPIAARSES
jgi:hypothetical protein